jgi:dethiobiotin synthetase
MEKKHFFVTGIGTDVGKTVVSAILAEALHATYWKPVQAGDVDFGDKDRVRSWCSEKVVVLPNRFALNTPASPHLAAKIDGISISLDEFELPIVSGNLIVEGAGGLLVPINESGDLYIDLIRKFELPVVVVSRHYLGSINHTLLTLEALKNQQIDVSLLVFVGEENEATESIILTHFPIQKVIRIPIAETVNGEFVRQEAARIGSLI